MTPNEANPSVEHERDAHQAVEHEGAEFAKFLAAVAAIGALMSVGAAAGLVGLSLVVTAFGWLTSGFTP